MIPDAEVRRIADRSGVEPGIIDLDYALGWALMGLAAHPELRERLVFKGGTSLRKCWFPDYRFSEDLDFTITGPLGPTALERAVHEAFRSAQDLSGIDFAAQAPVMEVLNDEYGRESVQLRIYYRGPHRSGGSPRAIRLDATRDETMVFPPESRRMIHGYSDAADLGEVTWPCYALEEVVAEKLRAVLAQRRFAVARDLYDIHRLLDHGIDEKRTIEALPGKLEVKGLALHQVVPDRMLSRKEQYMVDWTRHLVPLVQPTTLPDFEDVWLEVSRFLGKVILSRAGKGRPPVPGDEIPAASSEE